MAYLLLASTSAHSSPVHTAQLVKTDCSLEVLLVHPPPVILFFS